MYWPDDGEQQVSNIRLTDNNIAMTCSLHIVRKAFGCNDKLHGRNCGHVLFDTILLTAEEYCCIGWLAALCEIPSTGTASDHFPLTTQVSS